MYNKEFIPHSALTTIVLLILIANNSALRYVGSNRPSPEPKLQSTDVDLQITDEKRRTMERGHERRVIRALHQLDVARGRRYVVHIQTEERRGDESTPGHSRPQAATRLEGQVWRIRLSSYDEMVSTRQDGYYFLCQSLRKTPQKCLVKHQNFVFLRVRYLRFVRSLCRK